MKELGGRFRELLSGPAGMPAVLLVPLVSGGETVGMLSLKSMTPNAYSGRHVELAERIGRQIAGAVANAQVYVELKEVEEAVRLVIERMDLAVDGADDGLWDWKIPDNQVWWSPRLREMLNLSDPSPDDTPRGWEARLHPDDHDRVIWALNDHLERGTPYDLEYRLSTESGEYRWYSDRGKAIRDGDGKAVRMSGALRDITDAKEAGTRDYTGQVNLRGPHDGAGHPRPRAGHAPRRCRRANIAPS
jgi:PAS domain-containing protein